MSDFQLHSRSRGSITLVTFRAVASVGKTFESRPSRVKSPPNNGTTNFPLLVSAVHLYAVFSSELYAACRTTKKAVLFPSWSLRCVTAMSGLLVNDPLIVLGMRFVGSEERYAGETLMKLACSFSSLYFSRAILRYSSMAAP